MGKSVTRVREAAHVAGLAVDIVTLPATARTAADAAAACGCMIGQIAKSMIFEGAHSATLVLVLVSGAHDLDLRRAQALTGEPLGRADPKRVRAETGFAIGGVAPIGHLRAMPTFMDDALMQYPVIWGAGGAPRTVFAVAPLELMRVTRARLFSNS